MKVGHKPLHKRPRVPFLAPKHCLECNAASGYILSQETQLVELKSEKFAITSECMRCLECGHTIMSEKQIGMRVCKTVKTYQERHGLLTADEIRTRRLTLGFETQQELADAAPDIAIATLKRLEASRRVQDKATDRSLRAELEALELKQQWIEIEKLGEELDETPSEIVNYNAAASMNWCGGSDSQTETSVVFLEISESWSGSYKTTAKGCVPC